MLIIIIIIIIIIIVIIVIVSTRLIFGVPGHFLFLLHKTSEFRWLYFFKRSKNSKAILPLTKKKYGVYW